jgi:hypothetical protein
VQTLLKVTNAKVCANIVDAKSLFARASGMMIALKRICGRKARDSKCRDDSALGEELRYNIVLYGEKL